MEICCATNGEVSLSHLELAGIGHMKLNTLLLNSLFFCSHHFIDSLKTVFFIIGNYIFKKRQQ